MLLSRTIQLAGLLLTPLAVAQDPRDILFDPLSDTAFGDPRPALREFLRSQHVSRWKRAQNFCLVGYQSASGNERRAWVHWPEGHKLVLWMGGQAGVAQFSRITDVTKDVVAAEADLYGDPARVTQAWANQVMSDGATRGLKYQLRAQ
jgi:hypothetical protein